MGKDKDKGKGKGEPDFSKMTPKELAKFFRDRAVIREAEDQARIGWLKDNAPELFIPPKDEDD